MNNLVLFPIPLADVKAIVSAAVQEALANKEVSSQRLDKSVRMVELMSPEQLSDYLPEHPARQTIYGWVNNRKVPFEKHGRSLLFRKSLIDEWLNNGRQFNHLKED